MRLLRRCSVRSTWPPRDNVNVDKERDSAVHKEGERYRYDRRCRRRRRRRRRMHWNPTRRPRLDNDQRLANVGVTGTHVANVKNVLRLISFFVHIDCSANGIHPCFGKPFRCYYTLLHRPVNCNITVAHTFR